MNDYIFISADALEEFATNRFYQSADYEQCAQLLSVLKRESNTWENQRLFLSEVVRGIVFHTAKIDKKRGVLFDLTTFHGFKEQKDSSIINIFQKVIKYAIKYYNKLPLMGSERLVSDSLTLIYPFPFSAQKEVDKVYVDRNSSSQNRAQQDYLTVFYYGHDPNANPNFACLNKAVEELKKVDFISAKADEHPRINSMQVTSLNEEPKSFTIDERIGLERWEQYLTHPQLSFVRRDVVGAERLEGAAGSGKSITMILRCVYLLTRTHLNEDFHIIFITHSLASKETLMESFIANCADADHYIEKEGNRPQHSILITTLQEWSGKNLGTNSIEDSEYLDKDAADSKLYQYMYIEQAIGEVKEKNWAGYSVLCSNGFKHFIETASKELMTELFRYEISVLIKGRSDGDFEKYKEIQRPKLSLPLETVEDRQFAYNVYLQYQKSLEAIGQYDSDDITLSALGQINTPIWRRRSMRDGYDVCFVDETQLFNLNELSVFHYLNKPEKASHIVYAIDKTQTFGEVGFTEEELKSIIKESSHDLRLETIFRSSPAIVDLAFNVLASNATIFTNYENPLDKCSYSYTSVEEAKCEKPSYVLCETDEQMIKEALDEAARYHHDKKVEKGDILLVATSSEIVHLIEKDETRSRSIIKLNGKNDLKSRQIAMNKHAYVLSEIDYVGGLEFDCVIIIGVDKGRVPPESEHTNYSQYAWHNRMYVAITRGKYAVKMYGNKVKGESPVLESALYNGLLEENNK